MRARILGTGGHLPETILTSEALAERLGIDAAWIVERTGIRARRIAGDGETTSGLATAAARQALDAAGLDAQAIDLILVATVTPDSPTPSTAALVQAQLGATRAAAFDVSAACAGGLFALTVAEQFIKTGLIRNALVIGAEILSRSIDWSDRNTAVLFGDGAGALVLAPDDGAEGEAGPGILARRLHTDGTLAPILAIPGPGTGVGASFRDPRFEEERLWAIKMNGREVFRTAVRALTTAADEVVSDAGRTLADVTHVMGHQANLRIIESVMARLELPMSRCRLNLDRYGNTSAASVLLLIDEAARGGALHKGDLLLCLVAGAGMTWGGMLIRW